MTSRDAITMPAAITIVYGKSTALASGGLEAIGMGSRGPAIENRAPAAAGMNNRWRRRWLYATTALPPRAATGGRRRAEAPLADEETARYDAGAGGVRRRRR